MIKFDRLWTMLKLRGITQYQLIHDYGISKGQLDRLKKNDNITTNTLDILCNILKCDVGEIAEHIPDGNDRFKPDDYSY